MDSEKGRFDGSSGEAGENHQAPVVDRLQCKHVSRSFQEELMAQKQAHDH